VRAAIERLAAGQFVRRLWDADASLWTRDPTVQAAIRTRLGWLTIAHAMAGQLPVISQAAQELREAGFSHALLLGMGGSGLFPEVCRHTLGRGERALDVTVLDSTDPAAIRAHQCRGPLERLVVIVSSKSGTTSEVHALLAYFYEMLKAARKDPGRQCLAITDAGTPLEARARELGFRRVFAHGPGMGAEVGGRFSALTYFGLVPAALMGVDVGRIVQRAQEMLAVCGPDRDMAENPAAQLGALLGALAKAGRDKLTLLCGPLQERFGVWVEQLIAESLGKQGRGIVPIHGEPMKDAASYGRDRVFVELQVGSQRHDDLARQADALEQAGHPVVRVRWDDPYDLGGEVVKWCLATAVAGSQLEINPFDEPDVQVSKDRTSLMLEQFTRAGRWPERPFASCRDDGLTLYAATPPHPVASPVEWLRAFVRGLRPGDYVAVLSFLPRLPMVDEAVASLRARLAERLEAPTMLGFGPRYLHSTGQLYKGGPNTGAFLLLTADEDDDLPIPGQPFSFGILKQAQALGDVEIMQERGRRVLRIHLAGALDQALTRLARLLDDAT
jgi:glucose-6-phosphate isomerase